jgi:hypothetical protein
VANTIATLIHPKGFEFNQLFYFFVKMLNLGSLDQARGQVRAIEIAVSARCAFVADAAF